MNQEVTSATRTHPLDADLATMAAAVRNGEITALALIDASLARVAQLDPALHAFCTLTADAAREEARRVDAHIARGETVGPLAGIPVAIKDLVCTKGVLTTFGSRLYADHVPDEDDVVVERLKAAGAIVIGKTNTSEFGYGAVGHNPLFETTRNPWNTALTPGGSSAGSAVAVATGMVPLAIGSDGGGSVRVPAALCGIFGIKPSWGRVPVYPGCRDERYPGISSWESLEHIGPLTRTAADAALAMSVLAGPTSRDRHSIPAESNDWSIRPAETLRGARLALSIDLGHATVDAEVRAATQLAAERLAHVLGCRLETAHPGIAPTQPMFETLVALDTDRQGLRELAAAKRIKLGGWLGHLVDHPWTADDFTYAIVERKRIVNAVWRFMEHHDFLLTPTTAAPAFALDVDGPDEIDGNKVVRTAWLAFSAIANLTGLPAASVPIGLTRDGRPIGLQIMGKHLDDRGVLALSAIVESLYPMTMPPV
ncbi:MAG: hypothetical protein JWL63_3104 [Rhodocyclales bacterium]|nr:hypothetical protein [Rhodocyclales bacterium]